MTLVPSHPQPSNGNNLLVKKYRLLIIFFIAFVSLVLQAQQKPESFISHKVKKRETIFGITRSYNISERQLIEFNPLLEKVGLRKRMLLRIPVYKQQKKEVIDTLVDEGKGTQVYIVKPKETKWRIAYNFKITIPELEALNRLIESKRESFSTSKSFSILYSPLASPGTRSTMPACNPSSEICGFKESKTVLVTPIFFSIR